MIRTPLLLSGCLAAFLPLAVAAADLDPSKQWPQWRGPLGTGVAPHGKPPLRWAEDRNVRWKVPLPGTGHSTPVIWGDRIFVTTAVPHGERLQARRRHAHGAHDNVASSRSLRFVVIAIDRRDGAMLWSTTVREQQPHDSAHASGSWASNSAVTDGRRVYASFGSAGIFALDLDGKVLWSKDLGDLEIKHGHGEGSSPALWGDTLVVNWDHEGDSFVVALDTRSGEERWRVPRDEATSWSSPLVVEHAGKRQVIVAATKRVRAYDLENGRQIWEAGGLGGNVVASPVSGDGRVYVANSYDTRALLAIRLAAAKGDVTGGKAIAWRRDRDTPYVPSPVLYDDALCFLKHYQGVLTCVAGETGETLVGPRRLPGIRNVYASLTGADGRIYIVDRDGTTAVVRRGGAFEPLSQNRLDDSFSASPAIVGDSLFLRGERYLYRLAEPAD
jgi:outer membrane protein assembly factor BamB